MVSHKKMRGLKTVKDSERSTTKLSGNQLHRESRYFWQCPLTSHCVMSMQPWFQTRVLCTSHAVTAHTNKRSLIQDYCVLQTADCHHPHSFLLFSGEQNLPVFPSRMFTGMYQTVILYTDLDHIVLEWFHFQT